MSTVKVLWDKYNECDNDVDRGYYAAQLFCATHSDIGPEDLRKLILAEAEIFADEERRDTDKGAFRWIDEQLESGE
jgi:hypothetical protein